MGVSYGTINITFRRSKNRDFRVREGLIVRLRTIYPTYYESELRFFCQVVTQVDEGRETLPFVLPTLESSDDELKAAYEGWDELDEGFSSDCWAEIEKIQQPADATTGPMPLPEGAEKNS